jgi:hypothetical protein
MTDKRVIPDIGMPPRSFIVLCVITEKGVRVHRFRVAQVDTLEEAREAIKADRKGAKETFGGLLSVAGGTREYAVWRATGWERKL